MFCLIYMDVVVFYEEGSFVIGIREGIRCLILS